MGAGRACLPLTSLKPDAMEELIRSIVDVGDFMEVQEGYAKNMIVGYARMDAHLGNGGLRICVEQLGSVANDTSKLLV